MTPELWKRVSDAFDHAADLETTARGDFLDRLRRSDAEAAATVEDMLKRQAGPNMLDAVSTRIVDFIDTGGSVPAAPVDAKENLPERIDHYTVEHEIARGGMGVVLRVHDDKFNRPLAVKVLAAKFANDAEMAKRFRAESLMGRLQHPGVAPVHERGELPDGRPYLVMKLIRGRTLAQILKTQPRDQARLLGIFEQTCHTLAYAHSHNVIHRDLKPGNIMVGAFGEVQVVDWGLAKFVQPPEQSATPSSDITVDAPSVFAPPSSALRTDTVFGAIMGTPSYMAPEQARGEVDTLDVRCDVFGLGALLCTILTGGPPFTARTDAENIVLSRAGNLTDAFARLDSCGMDPQLVAIAKECLAPVRTDRPKDAGAVAEKIVQFQAQLKQRLEKAEIERAAAKVRAEEERRRRRVTLALAAVILVSILLGAWYYHDREAMADAGRRQLLEREVQAALKEEDKRALVLADALADYRKAQDWLSDPDAWRRQLEQRQEFLQRAQHLLTGDSAGHDPGLAEQARLQAVRLQTDQADYALAKELDGIRLESFIIIDTPWNPTAATKSYAQFFQKHLKADVTKDAPDAVASAIAKAPLKHALVAVLDHWADLSQHAEGGDKDMTRRLLHVARLADPDPWRTRFRSESAWKSLQELDRLAAELWTSRGGAYQSPQIWLTLASQLERLGGNGLGLREAALVHHPHDFWINLTTANLATYWDVRAGYYQAALAIRSRSSVAWNNRAVALFNQHKLEEALSACEWASEVNAKDWAPHHLVGRIRQFQGHYAEARAALKRAIDLVGKDHPYHPRVLGPWEDCLRCQEIQERERQQPILEGDDLVRKGTLTKDDPLDFYFDTRKGPRKVYLVRLKKDQSVHVELKSSAFDAILRLEDADCRPLVMNDDASPPESRDAGLVFTPREDGVVRVVVNAFLGEKEKRSMGDFELSLRSIPPIGKFKPIQGELTKLSPRVDAKHQESHEITLTKGVSYVIELRSQRFDTVLRLLNADRKSIATNDDVTPGNHQVSRIDFTPAATGKFHLLATSYAANETGPYTVTIHGFKPKNARDSGRDTERVPRPE